MSRKKADLNPVCGILDLQTGTATRLEIGTLSQPPSGRGLGAGAEELGRDQTPKVLCKSSGWQGCGLETANFCYTLETNHAEEADTKWIC